MCEIQCDVMQSQLPYFLSNLFIKPKLYSWIFIELFFRKHNQFYSVLFIWQNVCCSVACLEIHVTAVDDAS